VIKLEAQGAPLFDNLQFLRCLSDSRWLFGFWDRFGASSFLADSFRLLQSFCSSSRLAPSLGFCLIYFLFSCWGCFRNYFWWVSFFSQRLGCRWLNRMLQLLWLRLWLVLRRHRWCLFWESLYGTLVLLAILFSLRVRSFSFKLLFSYLVEVLSRFAQALLVWVGCGCPCCGLPTNLLLFCLSLKVAYEGTRGCRDGIVNSLNLLVEHVFKVLICLRVCYQSRETGPMLVKNRNQLGP